MTKNRSNGNKRGWRRSTAVLIGALLAATALFTAAYYILDNNTGEEYVVDVGEISEETAADGQE